MIKFTVSITMPFGEWKSIGNKKKGELEHSATSSGESNVERQVKECFFKKYAKRLTAEAESDGKERRAANYRTAVNSFFKFYGKSEIAVERIDAALMRHFEKWLCEQGVCRNTSSCYMRALRAIYNKVIKQNNLVDKRPFENVFTGNAKTVKRALSESNINGLANLELAPGTRLCLARDIFLFCYYTMGMPFIDVANLQKKGIKGGIISYYRHKTGQLIKVKLEPCILEIIKRYNNPNSEYVFPIIKGHTLEEKDRSERSAISYYNRLLKRIGKMVGISQPLTSYVARHSWASLASRKGVSINVISQALGHTSIATTQIYMKEIDSSVVFKANKKVLKGINGATLYKKYTTDSHQSVRVPKCTY